MPLSDLGLLIERKSISLSFLGYLFKKRSEFSKSPLLGIQSLSPVQLFATPWAAVHGVAKRRTRLTPLSVQESIVYTHPPTSSLSVQLLMGV